VTVEISEVDEEDISKSQCTAMAAVHVGEMGYAARKARLVSAGGSGTIGTPTITEQASVR
jgi:hypothetical protein